MYDLGAVEALEEEERQKGPKTIYEGIVTENTYEKHQITDFWEVPSTLSKINKIQQLYIQ